MSAFVSCKKEDSKRCWQCRTVITPINGNQGIYDNEICDKSKEEIEQFEKENNGNGIATDCK